jgi:hypothetical protein
MVDQIQVGVKSKVLTGNPTATLRSAILLVPACRSIGPLNVKLGFSFVPKAEPANGDRNLMII